MKGGPRRAVAREGRKKMAKGAYIGVQTSHTYTNILGGIGDMETGTVYKTTAEAAYLKNSSQHKFGSSCQAFQQSGSATELTYTLRNSSGQMSFALDNTHKYYFSVWIRQNTSLDLSFDWYWPIAEPSVMSGVKNAALNTWEHHSAVVSRSGFTSGSYPMRIDCNNYPGNNALMYVDGLMVVDLTATYGAGNEPTKEFCDQYFAFTTGTNTVTIPTARKVKKMYIGVGGVARKVKKGYIGIGGVARLFFSSGLAYYGTITGLSAARYGLAAATVGNYALFAGGNASGYTNITDAYDRSLVRTTPATMTNRRYYFSGASTGNYALFGGGNSSDTSTIDVYNGSLTNSTTTTTSAISTFYTAAAQVGGYAILKSGRPYTNQNNNGNSYAFAYNASLTCTRLSTNSYAQQAATTIGNYAIFAGGRNSSGYTNTAATINTSLTYSTITGLSSKRALLAGASTGDYALFGGGQGTSTSNVDAYDASLTKTMPETLSAARQSLSAAGVGGYAIFAGGYNGLTTTDAYDASLTIQTIDDLADGRDSFAAAVLDNYILFGGGQNSSGALASTEVYNV